MRPAGARCRRHALVAAACLLAGGAASGLTDEEIFRDLRFDFLSPGARALGMGGAFIATAGDVTAAAANPAGLHFIDGPEAFVEARVVDGDERSIESRSGSLAVDTQTGARDLPFLALGAVSTPDTITEPSFVGLAWPLRVGRSARRLTVAGSRQVLLAEDRTLGTGERRTGARLSFETFPNTADGNEVVAYSVSTPVSGGHSADVVYWSASASLDLHEDFSVGVALSYATLDFKADVSTEVIDPLELFLDPGNPRSPSQPSRDVFRTSIDDSDGDLAFALGLHWHPDSVFAGGPSPWRLGAAFRRGAAFSVSESTFLNGRPEATFDTTLVVPDRFGLGLSYQMRGPWLFTAEVERIEYTDMLEGFRAGVNFLTSDHLAAGAFARAPGKEVTFDVDDGTLLRAGVEYARPLAAARSARIAVRGGWFRVPDGRIHLTRFASADPDVNRTYLEAFPAGGDEDHLTAGVGFSFGRSSLEIAGETSDEGSRIVASYALALRRGGEVGP